MIVHLPDLKASFKWNVSCLQNNTYPIPSDCNDAAQISAKAFAELHSLLCPTLALEVRFESGIPVGAGLGSSASFCVCAATVLLSMARRVSIPPSTTKDLELINQYAFIAEKVIHGNPSGLDNLICTFGMTLQS